MNKTTYEIVKKPIAGMVIVMMLLSSMQGTINTIYASTQSFVTDAKAKIQHLTNSINNNYAGIKNQAQWEIYIGEAQVLINKIPYENKEDITKLSGQLDDLRKTVLSIARINQVEKSYEVNYHGIKNAAQWRKYLELAAEDMKAIDKNVFKAKFEELTKRYNEIESKVKLIEDEHNESLKKVQNLYEEAKKALDIKKAEKALEEANKLGTHETSSEIIEKIKNLITDINNHKEIENISKLEIEESTFDTDRVDQKIQVKVNDLNTGVDYLKTLGYQVKFIATDRNGEVANIFNGKNSSETGVISPASGQGSLTKGDYNIEVQIVKSGVIVISSKGNIKIINSDENITITDVNIANVSTKGDPEALVDWLKDDADIMYDNDNSRYIDEFVGSAFKMNSNTLVSGEKAKICGVFANMNGLENTLVKEEEIEVISSNPKVISVSKDKGTGMAYLWGSNTKGEYTKAENVLKAQSPGEAVITIKAKNTEKKITMKVTNEKRKLSKMVPEKTVYNISGDLNVAIIGKIKVFDQFGDPIGIEGKTDHYPKIPNIDGKPVVTGSIGVETDKININGKQRNLFGYITISSKNNPGGIGDGLVQFDIDPALFRNMADLMGESTRIYFINNEKDPNTGVRDRQVLSLADVSITKNNVTTNYKLKGFLENGMASDFKMDLAKEETKTITVGLEEYSSDGVALNRPYMDCAKETSTTESKYKYEIESLNRDIVDIEGKSGLITIKTVGNTGKTSLVVRNKETKKVVLTQEVVVTDSKIELQSVTFNSLPTVIYKNNKIKLKDIMDITETSNDYIVNGITLTKNTDAKVRIAKSEDTDIKRNELYLDVDSSGKFSKGDIKLGSIEAGVISTDNDLLKIKEPVPYLGDEIIVTPSEKTTGTVIIKVLKENKSIILGAETFKIDIK